MFIDRLMDLMNVILEKQLDIITIINLFVLSFPFIFALSVPMSVLMATIMAFGRLSVDRELTAIKSTGINTIRMTSLVMIFMLIVSVGMAYFNDYILPETNHLLKNVLIKVSYRKPITAIKPGTFTTMNNLTIFARERTDEALYDLLIFNLENVRFPQTIYAEKGEIYLDPLSDRLKVILYEGEMHERDIAEGEQYQIGTFEQYTLFLENMGFSEDDTSTDYRGDREMTSTQMIELFNERKLEVENLEREIAGFQRILDELENTDTPIEVILGEDVEQTSMIGRGVEELQDTSYMLQDAPPLPPPTHTSWGGQNETPPPESTEASSGTTWGRQNDSGVIVHDWNEFREDPFQHRQQSTAGMQSLHSPSGQRQTPPRNRSDEIRRHTVMMSLRVSQKNEIERQMRRYLVEMHKKYSLAAACFVMMLVGVAIGMMTKTSGVGVSFTFSSIVFIIYYIFLVMGEEFGNKGDINPVFAMWFPSLFFLVVGIFLLHIARKEKRFDVMVIWVKVKSLMKKFRRIKN